MLPEDTHQPQGGHIIGTAVEFSFRGAPADRFILYNLHPSSDEGHRDGPSLGTFVNHVEARTAKPTAYPPIVVGDTDDVHLAEAEAARYRTVRNRQEREPVITYVGTGRSWQSRYDAAITRALLAPDVPEGGCGGPPDIALSDHCGILAELGMGPQMR